MHLKEVKVLGNPSVPFDS